MHRMHEIINGVPTILFGEPADRAYLYVHGKSGRMEEAERFAETACLRGWQTLSVELPEHGARMAERGFDPWHVVPELAAVMAYMQTRWKAVALYAVSIGAWFSMLAFENTRMGKCLFVSPVLDMEQLIHHMMQWAGVSEERLMREGEIQTDFGETLSWEYLSYVRAHPIESWNSPTSILYAGRDNLTARDTVDAFVGRFSCGLTVMEEGEHWFHTPEQLCVLQKWMEDNVCKSTM